MTAAQAWADTPRGMTFDGTDDFANLNRPLSAAHGAISHWVTTTDGSSFTRVISDTGGFFYVRFRSTSGALEANLYDGANRITSTSTKVVNDGEQHHVAVTWDSTTLRLYVDGLEEGSVAAGAIGDVTTYDLQAGGVSGNYTDCTIDDVLIYDRALTAPEIQTLYRLGRAGIYQRQQSVITTSAAPATDNVAGSGIIRVKSEARPSFSSGIATHDQSAYPRLWDGVVGSWCPSLGATGSTLRDLSGRHNHGTLTNTTLSTVWQPDGLDLDGTDDYISTNIDSEIDWSNDSWSVSIMAKSNNLSGIDAIISWGDGTKSPYGLWALTRGLGGYITFDVFSGGDITTSVQMTLGQWYHIVVVYTSATDVEVFVDGVSVGTSSSMTITPHPSAIPVRIGYSSFNSTTWNGTIDDVLIYDRALSPNEIQTLYRLGPGGIYQRQQSVMLNSAVSDTTIPIYSYHYNHNVGTRL
jgi:hypothetical protein